jgi:hypothetical protein
MKLAMKTEDLIEIVTAIFAAGVAYATFKFKIKSIEDRLRVLEKHQQMQSGRMWAIARGKT